MDHKTMMSDEESGVQGEKGIVAPEGIMPVVINIEQLVSWYKNRGTRPLTPMHGAPAFGHALFSNGVLGADLICVPRGNQFPLHIHPGHHLLLCLSGRGTFTTDGVVHQVRPGDLYGVDAHVAHAVGAGDEDDHWLISFGSPHMPVDSAARMTAVEEEGARSGEKGAVMTAEMRYYTDEKGVPARWLAELLGRLDRLTSSHQLFSLQQSLQGVEMTMTDYERIKAIVTGKFTRDARFSRASSERFLQMVASRVRLKDPA
jgi:quercetin dioxygenase-like cupin family protein